MGKEAHRDRRSVKLIGSYAPERRNAPSRGKLRCRCVRNAHTCAPWCVPYLSLPIYLPTYVPTYLPIIYPSTHIRCGTNRLPAEQVRRLFSAAPSRRLNSSNYTRRRRSFPPFVTSFVCPRPAFRPDISRRACVNS